MGDIKGSDLEQKAGVTVGVHYTRTFSSDQFPDGSSTPSNPLAQGASLAGNGGGFTVSYNAAYKETNTDTGGMIVGPIVGYDRFSITRKNGWVIDDDCYVLPDGTDCETKTTTVTDIKLGHIFGVRWAAFEVEMNFGALMSIIADQVKVGLFINGGLRIFLNSPTVEGADGTQHYIGRFGFGMEFGGTTESILKIDKRMQANLSVLYQF